MTALSERLLARYYADTPHPYKLFERAVEARLTRKAVLLDAGGGRTVPVLRKFLGRAKRLIGVELVEFADVPPGMETCNTDLAHLPLPDAAVDIIMSRSVFEHLSGPEAVYREFARVLRPGGVVIVLTAPKWDYCTWVARLVTIRFQRASSARWRAVPKRTPSPPNAGPTRAAMSDSWRFASA